MKKKTNAKRSATGKIKTRKPSDLPVKKSDKVRGGGGGLRRTSGIQSASITGSSIVV
jgi:hypothetical protein